MSEIRRAVVKSYDAASHEADVQIAGSLAVWLDAVRVATNIPPADVVAGRQCTVLFLDPSNQDDAVIIAIQGAAPSVGEILQANASSSLTLTTSYQDIVGATVTLPTPGDWLIAATFYFLGSGAGDAAADALGQLLVDGVAQTGQAILAELYHQAGGTYVHAVSVTRTWKVTTTGDNIIAKLQAKKSAGSGSSTAAAPHTTITASGVKRSTGGGGGAPDIHESGVLVLAAADPIDFKGGFDVAVDGAGVDVSLDVDESPLSGLLKLAGRAGGQVARGGTGVREQLHLESTAHATKGWVYVVAGNPLKVGTGTRTGAIGISQGHDTLFGFGIPIFNPALYFVESGVPVANAVGGQFDLGMSAGISGQAALAGHSVARAALTDCRGLNFFYGAASGTHSVTNDEGVAITAILQSWTSGGVIANLRGLTVYPPTGGGATGAITKLMGLHIQDVGTSLAATTYGIKIDDLTAGSVATRLIEAGPATPYFRVVGAVAPGAQLSNVWTDFGGVGLRQIQVDAINTAGAGFRQVRVLN